MTRTLAMDDIQKLLKSEARTSKDPTGATYKERWPGDANLIKIAKAVKRGADFVVFRNGQRFNLTRRDTDLVLVKPDSGFVPMGYFSIKKLKEAEHEGIDLDDK